ncbi:hypothetical protein HAX54_004968, partial [Datura stramonium]|nr:hypothetical protein [Datura stramonium]
MERASNSVPSSAPLGSQANIDNCLVALLHQEIIDLRALIVQVLEDYAKSLGKEINKESSSSMDKLLCWTLRE